MRLYHSDLLSKQKSWKLHASKLRAGIESNCMYKQLTTQLLPLAQVPQPVYPVPPHCWYFAMGVQPPPLLALVVTGRAEVTRVEDLGGA